MMDAQISGSRFRLRTTSASVQERFVEAVADLLQTPPDAKRVRSNPLELRLQAPLPSRARFYVYQATSHDSERDKNVWKIQPTIGERGARNWFNWAENHMVYLLGWVPAFGVWIVYDAKLQEGTKGLPFSKSCYVDASAVLDAAVTGMEETITILRNPRREERIFVCTDSRLPVALLRRFRIHLELEDK